MLLTGRSDVARTLAGIRPLLGHIVYKPFEPQRPGKIVDIITDDGYKEVVKVRWLKDGSETIENYLNSFEALVEDTERKAKNHRKALEATKKL
jgi:hypothetical protein